VPATPVVSFELEDDLPYFVGNAKVLVASTCNLRKVLSEISGGEAAFFTFLKKIKTSGGNYAKFVDKLATESFSKAEIEALQTALGKLNDAKLKTFVDDFDKMADAMKTTSTTTTANRVKSWEVLLNNKSSFRTSKIAIDNLTNLLTSNKFGWTIDNFNQLFTKMLNDVRPGTSITYVDDVGETITDVVGKTLNEEEMLQSLSQLNSLNILNTNGVVKELCCESSWKFVGAEMVLRTVRKDNLWNSIEAFEKYVNQRYIDILLTTGKRIELKSWKKIYSASFIKQFIDKDLTSVIRLEDLEWAFDGKYPTNLKNDILAVLKSNNGKAALNNLGFNQAKQLFPNDELMDNLNYADRIIKNFEKDEVFNLIFKLK
jgi:hypothetical protein